MLVNMSFSRGFSFLRARVFTLIKDSQRSSHNSRNNIPQAVVEMEFVSDTQAGTVQKYELVHNAEGIYAKYA